MSIEKASTTVSIINAFIAGFEASEAHFNGDYPFRDGRKKPVGNELFRAKLHGYLKSLGLSMDTEEQGDNAQESVTDSTANTDVSASETIFESEPKEGSEELSEVDSKEETE